MLCVGVANRPFDVFAVVRENLLDFKCLRNPESERLVDNLSGMPPRTM